MGDERKLLTGGLWGVAVGVTVGYIIWTVLKRLSPPPDHRDTLHPDQDTATIRLTRAANVGVRVGWFTLRSYPPS